MTKNKLYLLLFIACFFGFIYLFYNLRYSDTTDFSVCLIKNVTGFACPSCGTTRSVKLLLQGKVQESLLMNPFGILIALIMAIVPFWISFDLIFKNETFYIYYKKTEETLKIKWLATVLIVLVLLNWIWNIYKEI